MTFILDNWLWTIVIPIAVALRIIGVTVTVKFGKRSDEK
jgi:hypothetical protein